MAVLFVRVSTIIFLIAVQTTTSSAPNHSFRVRGSRARGSKSVLLLRSCVQGDASWGGGPEFVGTTSTFIFKLGGDGAASERFDTSGVDENYLYADAGSWPRWGGGSPDLIIGQGGAPGAGGYCNQGTYTAATNQVCGGNGNWGATELVVLGRLPPPPVRAPPLPSQTCH